MKHLLCLLLFSLPFQGWGQEDVAGFFHAGISYVSPSESFGSSNPDEPEAGFALPGLGLSVLFGNKVYHHFGISLKSEIQVSPVNTVALTRALAQQNGDFSWSMNPAIWRTAGISFGPHLSYNLKRWAFDARFLTGALNFFSPELNIRGETQSGSGDALFVVQEKSATSWSIAMEATMKYEFRKYWVVLANAGYMRAAPAFRDVSEKLYTNDVLILETSESYKQPFSMFQMGLGIGYVF